MRSAAVKLGYVPNAAARSLRARRTHILGLILDDLADPVHGKVAAGFEEAAASRGYAVFMMTGLHDPEREQRALTVLAEHRADGVALASCVSDPADVFRRLPRIGSSSSSRITPRWPTGPNPRRVAYSAPMTRRGSAMVDHVVERGYRRIAYVGPGSGSSDALRRAAASEALEGMDSARCASSIRDRMAGVTRRWLPSDLRRMRRTP